MEKYTDRSAILRLIEARTERLFYLNYQRAKEVNNTMKPFIKVPELVGYFLKCCTYYETYEKAMEAFIELNPTKDDKELQEVLMALFDELTTVFSLI